MIINKRIDGSKLTIYIEGRLDTSTSPELSKELEREKMEIYALMTQENAEDSTGVDYGVENLISFDDTSSQKTPKEWRLSEYKGDVARRNDSERIAAWDKLEKSIVANIADDITVEIKGETVMIVIAKEI